jgi:hypothetical protein
VILVVLSLDAIRRGVDVSAAALLAGSAAVGAVVLFALGLIAAARERRIAWFAGLAGLVGLIVLIGLRETESRYVDGRYAGVTPTLDAALARAPDGTRIGLAGAWPVTTLSPVLALFGPDLANDVRYVGATRDGMLVPSNDAAEFRDALERDGYDLVMVGSEKPLAFPLRDVAAWTRAAGYSEIATDENFTLFQEDADR